MLAEARAAGLEFELIAVREGDKLPFRTDSRVILTAAAFRAATQTVTPQGVIAIARVDEASASEAIGAARESRWPLLVLDGVQDPGNVGAICRTAAAAGASALAVLPGTADPYGPKAVRASAGNVFRLKVARAHWKDLAELDGYGASSTGGAPLAEARVTSLSVIAPTPECRTRTLISSVDRRFSAWTIASTEPCTSALTTSGSSLVVAAWFANIFSRLTGADVVRFRSSTPCR